MMSVLKFSGDIERPLWEGFVLVASLFVVNMLNAVLFVAVFTIMITAGMCIYITYLTDVFLSHFSVSGRAVEQNGHGTRSWD